MILDGLPCCDGDRNLAHRRSPEILHRRPFDAATVVTSDPPLAPSARLPRQEIFLTFHEGRGNVSVPGRSKLPPEGLNQKWVSLASAVIGRGLECVGESTRWDLQN
jgi:hypothetical protein